MLIFTFVYKEIKCRGVNLKKQYAYFGNLIVQFMLVYASNQVLAYDLPNQYTNIELNS